MERIGYTNKPTAKDLYSNVQSDQNVNPFDQNPFDKNPFDGELQQVMANEEGELGKDDEQMNFGGKTQIEETKGPDSKTETTTNPIEGAWLLLYNYINAHKGRVNDFRQLPFYSKEAHLFLKVSKQNETPTYVHVEVLSDGKPEMESITQSEYETNLEGHENKLLFAQDKKGRSAEIFVSNIFMRPVVVYAYDLDRLDKLRQFAKNDEGFWNAYNYPEDEAALLFASLNMRERSEIIQSEALLQQIGSKLSKAQFARGLQNLDLSLHKKLELLSNGKNAYTHKGIMFQDLRGVLLSSGAEGKKMDARLIEVFPLTAIIREEFLLDNDIFNRYIESRRLSDRNKFKSSNMIGDLLFDDMLDSDEMTLTPAETKLINTIVEGGKTLADLSDSEKKTLLTAFQRNALKLTFQILELSENAVIESSDILLNGQAEEIHKALMEESASFKKMDELDQEKKENYEHTHDKHDNKENIRRILEKERVNNEIKVIETGVRERLSEKFPILADPKLDLRSIYRNYGGKDSIPELEEYLRKHLSWVFDNIEETRRVLRENPDQVFKLEKLIELAKQQMGWIPLMDELVDEKVAAIAWNDFMFSIGMAIVSLGLAFVSFGTLSGFSAAILATTSFVVSGVDFYYTYQNYEFEKTTGGTSIDPALSLSFSNPSFVWVIASLAGVVADVMSVAKVVKTADAINFSKTGTGGSEIANKIDEKKLIKEGFNVADIIELLKNARKTKNLVKKYLLGVYDKELINLQELDELADIYLAKKIEKLKEFKTLEELDAFLKRDVPEWYNDLLKNGSKLLDDGLKESGKIDGGGVITEGNRIYKKGDKFDLDHNFVDGADNLVGSADLGWYTGYTAHFEILSIFKSPTSTESLFKNLTAEMERIAREADLSEIILEFKMVKNPRLAHDPTWAAEYGYHYFSSSDKFGTTVTWEKTLN